MQFKKLEDLKSNSNEKNPLIGTWQYVNGQDITNIPPYKRPVNTVFQRYALFPHLDVYDNVLFLVLVHCFELE